MKISALRYSPWLVLAIAAPALAQVSILTDATLPNAVVGSSYNQTLTATGGTPPYSWGFQSGSASTPPGIGLSGNTITGSATLASPTAASFTLTVTDSSNPQLSATKTFSLRVVNPLSITTTSLPNGTVGTPYSLQLSATGGAGSATYNWSATGLPPGLSISMSGLISGTPTGGSSPAVTITVQDTATPAAVPGQAILPLTVAGNTPLSITTTSLPNWTAGLAYNQSIQVTGGTPPYTFSISSGALPSGWMINSSGAITGTANTAGSPSFTVEVKDSAQTQATVSRQFNLTIAVAPSIPTTSVPSGSIGAAYSAQLQGSGGTGALIWDLNPGSAALPTGLTLSSTGLIQGTPTAAGTFSITVRARDTLNVSATRNLTLSITSGALSITTSSLPAASLSAGAYSTTLQATGGTGSYSWSVSGTLPPGLQFSNTTGVLSGTPTGTGQFSLTFTVTDSGTNTANRNLTLIVVQSPLTIPTATPLPQASVGQMYTANIQASGGSGSNYNFTLAGGTLPAGLTMATNGTISGTPTGAAGVATFTIQVTDSLGLVTTKQFTLNVSASSLAITTVSPLTEAIVGVPYTVVFQASGGTGSGFQYSQTQGSLPAGLNLSGNGALTGTPTAAGVFTFTIQVTDNGGGTNNKQFNLTVRAANLTITSTSLPIAVVNRAYAAPLTVTGGSAPYTWSISAGILPAGMTIDPNGQITGTPTQSGAYNLRLLVRDSTPGTPLSAQIDLSLQVVQFSITTIELPAARVGVAYSATLETVGGTAPITFSIVAGALPAGLTLNPNGTITGTPSSNSSAQVTFQARDNQNLTAVRQLLVRVESNIVITTASLPAGQIGQPYSAALQATGGSGSYAWAVTFDALPPGLTLNGGTGAISGTPIGSGRTYQFTVRVTDTLGGTTEKPFSIEIAGGLTISPASLPNPQPGTSYSQQLSATGGTAPYSFAQVAGTLPTGFALLPNGSISGVTAQTGSFTFTVQVTDAASRTATRAYTLVIGGGSTLQITTSSLPNATGGVQYVQTLSATGGSGSGYNWSLAGGTALPAGLSLNPLTGVISGITNASGTVNFTVQVTDSGGATATRALSITIGASGALSIVTTSIPNATQNSPYSTALQATGGSGTGYVWTIVVGQPSWLSISPAGVLSGTPPVTGTFNFTVQVQDSANATRTQLLSLNVTATGALTITPQSLPPGTIGATYSAQIAATGATGPVSFSLAVPNSLPPGLSLTSTGIISGVPSTAGVYNFTVRATDAGTTTATREFSITVSASGLTITTASPLPNGSTNTIYPGVTFAATGGSAPYVWTFDTLTPPGLTLNPSTGVLSGTPTSAGTFSFTIRVRDSVGAASIKQFQLTIGTSALTISTTALPPASVGANYNFAISAGGGTAPFTWLVVSGALPAGLTIGASSGVLSGLPTTTGTVSFTVQVTDSAGQSAQRGLSLSVNAPLSIATTALPGGSVGVAYSQTLQASGGTGAGYVWAMLSGSLPPGLVLTPTSGQIAGTPTTNGTSSFTIQVADTAGTIASRQLTITIGTALSITTANLPNAATGVAYNQTISAAGGTPPLQWSILSGELPAGIGLHATTGALAGTPTAAASTSFVVRVQDASGASATRQLTLLVAEGLTITTPSALPGAAENAAYSQSFAATGGSAPYAWSVLVGSLPPGLSLNAQTGAITGTPSALGNYSFIVQVTDARQQSATKPFTLAVSGRITVVTASPLPGGTVRSPYNEPLTAAGGAPPYTWSLAPGGTLPIGITISPGGAVTGTPTSAGAFTFTVQVTDSQGATATKLFTFIVGLSLNIGTASLPGGVAGTPYVQTLSASGGQSPYTWAITAGSLPPGLAISPQGVISGNPTGFGTFEFTAQATDALRNSTSTALSITVALPATPQILITGLPESVEPAQQPRLNISLNSAYPLPVEGTMTLTFASDAAVPLDDTAVRFSNGNRVVNFTIPANSTQAQLPQGFAMQTGTVAGTLTLAASLRTGSRDITPSPAPTTVARINRSAPLIDRVTARRVSGGLEVSIIGYATSREVTQAVFRFTPAPGSSLQTTELTVPLSDASRRWYESEQSRPFGSQFTLTQQFNVQGDTSAIASVTVTLTNTVGSSQSRTASF